MAKFMVTPARCDFWSPLEHSSRVAASPPLPPASNSCLRCRTRAARCEPARSLLLLDEPTNHLDIPSKEMLEEALRSFEGTVLAVSHDRYFLRRIATRVLEVGGGRVVDYKGDYEVYLSRNEDAAERQEAAMREAVL